MPVRSRKMGRRLPPVASRSNALSVKRPDGPSRDAVERSERDTDASLERAGPRAEAPLIDFRWDRYRGPRQRQEAADAFNQTCAAAEKLYGRSTEAHFGAEIDGFFASKAGSVLAGSEWLRERLLPTNPYDSPPFRFSSHVDVGHGAVALVGEGPASIVRDATAHELSHVRGRIDNILVEEAMADGGQGMLSALRGATLRDAQKWLSYVEAIELRDAPDAPRGDVEHGTYSLRREHVRLGWEVGRSRLAWETLVKRARRKRANSPQTVRSAEAAFRQTTDRQKRYLSALNWLAPTACARQSFFETLTRLDATETHRLVELLGAPRDANSLGTDAVHDELEAIHPDFGAAHLWATAAAAMLNGATSDRGVTGPTPSLQAVRAFTDLFRLTWSTTRGATAPEVDSWRQAGNELAIAWRQLAQRPNAERSLQVWMLRYLAARFTEVAGNVEERISKLETAPTAHPPAPADPRTFKPDGVDALWGELQKAFEAPRPGKAAAASADDRPSVGPPSVPKDALAGPSEDIPNSAPQRQEPHSDAPPDSGIADDRVPPSQKMPRAPDKAGGGPSKSPRSDMGGATREKMYAEDLKAYADFVRMDARSITDLEIEYENVLYKEEPVLESGFRTGRRNQKREMQADLEALVSGTRPKNLKDRLDLPGRPKPAIQLLLDCSGTMLGRPMQDAKRAIIQNVEGLKNFDADTGIIGFSKSPKVFKPLGRDEMTRDEQATLATFEPRHNAETRLAPALELAETALETQTDARQKIVEVVTDGEAQDATESAAVVARMRAKGICIIGLAIGSSPGLIRYMEKLFGEGNYVIARSTSEIPKALGATLLSTLRPQGG